MAQITLPANLQDLPPREKAQIYNQLISQGFGETAIRNAVEAKLGKQSNGDWGALKDLASIVESTNQAGQGGAFTTNFGDKGSWQFGQGAEYNEKNMIESSGAYFQRGDDVIVSDELFWNPDSPTGEKLAEKIDKTQGADKRAGVVITPYAVFQGKATNQQLLDEVKRSGADFVAIDPYIGFGVPKEQLLAWTREFVPKLNELGVGVKLVLQDFSKAGMEGETQAYNNELLQTPGISEFISFGLEDAKDLQGSSDWTSLTGGNQFQQPAPQAAASNQGLLAQAPTTAETTPVDRQAQTTTAPEGLLAQGAGMPNQIAQSIQQATQFLNSPENLRLAEGAATMQQVALPGGRSLNVYADGTAQEFTADGRVKVYNEAGETILNQTQQEYAQRGYLTPVVNALMAAAGGAVLGPAGAGLLSTPAAAAAGAGGTSLLRGGDLEDALKSAALAAAAAYGFEQLFPSDALTVAKDAVNMASQGASQDAIKAALIEKGVNAGTAGSIASDAVSGVSVNQIASDFSQIKLGGGTTPPAGGSPNLVNIVASNAPTTLATTAAPGVLGAIAPSLATTSPVVSATTPGLLNQQVQVQSQTGATQPGAATTIPGAAASLLTPTQTVPVTSQTTTTQQNTGPAGAMLGTTITTPTGQTVEIVDRSTKAQTTAPVLPVITSTPVVVQGKTVPVSDVAVPAGAAGAALGVTTPATPTSPFSATDAALAALLLGGAGSLLNQSQSGGFTMDQGLANAIINAPRPTYRGGVGGYQMPGMFQIAPTNVYNPFATTAPFGTGRFGGFSAPITLPRGLV